VTDAILTTATETGKETSENRTEGTKEGNLPEEDERGTGNRVCGPAARKSRTSSPEERQLRGKRAKR